jgi:hypothetical protein
MMKQRSLAAFIEHSPIVYADSQPSQKSQNGKGTKGKGKGKGKKEGDKGGKAKEKAGAPGASRGLVTVTDILSDRLTQLSKEYWPNKADPRSNRFDAAIVEKVYAEEVHPRSKGGSGQIPRVKEEGEVEGDGAEGAGAGAAGARLTLSQRLQLLEFSSYLESYLWPFFDAASASKAHVLSIAILINQKFKEGVGACVRACVPCSCCQAPLPPVAPCLQPRRNNKARRSHPPPPASSTQVPAWDNLRLGEDAAEKFQAFFVRVLEAYLQSPVQGGEEGPCVRVCVCVCVCVCRPWLVRCF